MKKFMFLLVGLMFFGCSKEDDQNPPIEKAKEEVLVAVDDQAITAENTAIVLEDLLDNDTVVDYARITAFDNETEHGGTVKDNRDGTLTYNPPQNFTGEDSFQYTICDNATPQNCSSATVVVTITEASPVAGDDAYQTAEDKILIISDYLKNDELVDNAAVVSLNSDGTTGTAFLQENGNIKYQPATAFAGEDSFTYTICDDDEIPTCSTATITVTVTDTGSPVANDDIVVVGTGSGEITLAGLIGNDNLLDDAIVSAVSGSANGKVQLKEDGSVAYQPNAGYVGDDSFTYSLCDDDNPEPTCSEATVTVKVIQTIAFNIPAELQDYYSNLTISSDTDLNFMVVSDLTIDEHTNILSYGQRHEYLYDADEDLDNPENVILMYTGESRYWREYQSGSNSYSPQTFNTEHIYPQSRLTSTDAVTDLHHLRVSDADVNSLRLNHPFAEGSGEAGLVTESSWYPGDEWKGDVARMLMYLNIRYGETFTKVGNLDLFLKWNAEDPVSAFELQRNNVIEGAQGNRNPFIDNPYLATLIWGGVTAENRWQ